MDTARLETNMQELSSMIRALISAVERQGVGSPDALRTARSASDERNKYSDRDSVNKIYEELYDIANRLSDSTASFDDLNKAVAVLNSEYVSMDQAAVSYIVNSDKINATMGRMLEIQDTLAEAQEEEEKLRRKKASSESAQIDASNRLAKAQKDLADFEAEEARKQRLRQYESILGDDSSSFRDRRNAVGGIIAEGVRDSVKSFADNLSENLSKMLGSLLNRVDKIIEDTEQYRSTITTRLQGFGGGEYNFGKLLDTIADGVGMSAYVTQTDVLKSIASATEKGIAFNIEQRGYLDALSDTIAQSFEAFDGSLTRLIRLQQSDTTAGRLGMEAQLTQLFNSMFQDSSYLAEGIRSSVQGALVDASALLSAQQATEFEYQVNKWLGALYEVGMDSSTISNLAGALNMIATGNTSGLSGNSLNSLFAMAASNSNLDYATLLKEGLNASNVNILLESVVNYLKTIAINSDNNVVASAWSSAFGLAITDLTAVRNLSSSDLSALMGNSSGYSGMLSTLGSSMGINTQGNRLGLSKMVSNVVDNAFTNISYGLMDNPLLYGMYQATNMIKGVTGGTKLPAVSVMGNMLDLSAFNLEDLIQGGIVGVSAIGEIVGALGELASGNMPTSFMGDITNGGIKTITRGGTVVNNNGISRTISTSNYIGNTSTSDIENSAIASQLDTGENMKSITGDFIEQEEGQKIEGMDELLEAVQHIDSSMFGSSVTPVMVDVSETSKVLSAINALASSSHVMNVRVDSFSENAQFKEMELVYSNMKNFMTDSFKRSMVEAMMEALSDSDIAKNIAGTRNSIGSTLSVSVVNDMMNPVYTRETMM